MLLFQVEKHLFYFQKLFDDLCPTYFKTKRDLNFQKFYTETLIIQKGQVVGKTAIIDSNYITPTGGTLPAGYFLPDLNFLKMLILVYHHHFLTI